MLPLRPLFLIQIDAPFSSRLSRYIQPPCHPVSGGVRLPRVPVLPTPVPFTGQTVGGTVAPLTDRAGPRGATFCPLSREHLGGRVPRRQAAAEAQWGVSAKRAPVQGWIQAAAAHVDGSPSMSEMFDWYVGIT